MALPFGFHVEYPSSRTEDGLTFSEAELRARFHGQSRITCGWCGAHHRSRNVETLVSWFHSHDCVPTTIRAISREHFGGTAPTHDSLTCACVLGEAA